MRRPLAWLARRHAPIVRRSGVDRESVRRSLVSVATPVAEAQGGGERSRGQARHGHEGKAGSRELHDAVLLSVVCSVRARRRSLGRRCWCLTKNGWRLWSAEEIWKEYILGSFLEKVLGIPCSVHV